MNGLNVTAKNILLKNGVYFDPVIEVITSVDRFIQRVLYCEICFGGEVELSDEKPDTVIVRTTVLDNHETLILVSHPDHMELFEKIKDYFKVINAMRSLRGSDRTHIELYGQRLNINFDVPIYGASMTAYLESVGVKFKQQPRQKELESLLGLYWSGEDVNEINTIL